MPPDLDLVGRVNQLVGFADQARRDGLLALDEAVKSIEDPFTRKGVQLVVDGTDPDLVARCSTPRTRRCASATPRAARRSCRPARSRRRWASSARCSVS